MPASTEHASPFDVPNPFERPLPRRLFSTLVKRPFERLFYLRKLTQLYELSTKGQGARDFLTEALEIMDVRYEVALEDLERIPRRGPLIVVANHPYGALEGIVLGHLLRSVRTDTKLLANYLLGRIPALREHMIYVDPFGRSKSARFNITPVRESIAWLKQGGVLGIFPAGKVSTLDVRRQIVRDLPWQEAVARMIRVTKVSVLPEFFEGSNDALFQIAALIHPRLRTVMLPRALVKSRSKTVRTRIGDPVPFSKLDSFERDADMLGYLRLRTYMLSPDERRKATERSASLRQREKRQKAIIPAVNPDVLTTELRQLSEEYKLVSSGAFEVWCAEAADIPNILREIGRLRECTFRAAGVGTGKPIDLDRFDHYYLHLFLWNKARREVVGAYRLGQTDRILPRFGLKGLYTSTLYKFAGQLAAHIDCALEMGRSWVRDEYQKQHSPLALLWRGIGAFLVKNPRYRILFGPVGINYDYEPISRQMMIKFLETHAYLPKLARLARPRKPPTWAGGPEVQRYGRLVADINEVSSLVSEIESDNKGVPVLLRQYLRLNAKFVSCHVDSSFGDSWTGLMFGDLTETDPRILERHMGKEGTARFLDFHRKRQVRVG
ncbi:MAG: lysophospholipid acyltransferase family protein [Phycisphaerales bacterium]|nr:MAG: lysophospholipid acyltransferase family protein [Phycisphaerales bacterium]